MGSGREAVIRWSGLSRGGGQTGVASSCFSSLSNRSCNICLAGSWGLNKSVQLKQWVQRHREHRTRWPGNQEVRSWVHPPGCREECVERPIGWVQGWLVLLARETEKGPQKSVLFVRLSKHACWSEQQRPLSISRVLFLSFFNSSTGKFGACFIPGLCKQSDLTLYASRPGLRLWRADVQGTVQATFILKDAFAGGVKPFELYPRLDSFDPGSGSLPERHLGLVSCFFREGWVLSWNEYSVYLLDTVNQVGGTAAPHSGVSRLIWGCLSGAGGNRIGSHALLVPLGQSRKSGEGLIICVDLKKYLVCYS